MSEQVNSASVLGIKIDSHTTKLFLFDVVNTKYNLLATSEATTTHVNPYHDIREGLFTAIDKLQKISGRFILDSEMNWIIPGQEDGNGVDQISVCYGFLDYVSIITVGLLDNVSMESNSNLMQLTHLKVSDQIRLNDPRKLEDIYSSIENNRPDMILLSGGTENGANKSVLRMLELIMFCTKNLSKSSLPDLIFAGNSTLTDKVQEITNNHQINLHISENIRPTLEIENLMPVLTTINEINNEILIKKLPNIDFIFNPSRTQPIPYTQAYGVMAKYLSKLNQEKNAKVLIIDFNKENILITGNDKKNNIKIYSEKNPLLNDPGEFLRDLDVNEIFQSLEERNDLELVQDYLWNKSIHPQSLPENKENLSIEKSVLKTQLRKSFIKFKERSGFDNTFHQILINGDLLPLFKSPNEVVLFLLDSIQPTGITNLFIDQHGILPILGTIAMNNTILPIHLLESSTISLLAKVYSISSKAKDGASLLNVKLEYTDGTFLEELITKGTITKLPITPGQIVKIFFDPIGNFNFQQLGKDFEKGVMVQGGSSGVIFDTRNRPLSYPKNDSERFLMINEWQKNLDL